MSAIWASDGGRQVVRDCYAEILRAWPVQSEQRHVSTCEGETFVVECGCASGPAVILLQGSGANTAMWLPDISAWATRCHVYAVDVIGEPGLSAPSRPPLTSDSYARWLDDVMNGLNLMEASLVGVSLGGWIALDYGTRRPTRVKKLVVISPAGIGRGRVGVILKVLALTLLGRWGRRKAMRMILGPMAGSPTPMDYQIGALAGLIGKHFRKRSARIPLFGDDALRGLTMPVLAVVGAKDALLDSRGTKRRLEKLVPTTVVRWLPEAGHYVRGQAASVVAFICEGHTSLAADHSRRDDGPS